MRNHLLAGASVLAVFTAQPVLAQAQDTGSTTQSTDAKTSQKDADAVADVVVTGSRISRPNLDSTVPITTVEGERFFQTGQVSIGDQLNQLPQLASTFSQSNSTRFLGTAGLNLLDLRNLGPQRTLVLVNGRRHVAGDILNSGVSVDVNTIPTDLIDRVEFVTGGSSAVYGSDAIAGVVNFVLKKDFDGLQIRGQGGVSSYKDAGSEFVSVLAGKNFSEGRGNIAINAEFAHQNQYFGTSRPYLAQQSRFVQVLPAGSGTASSPENILFNDVRNASYSTTGVVRFGGTSALNCGTAPNGSFYNCPYTFTPNGNLVPITGQRIGLGPTGSFQGGNGDNFRDRNQFQLQPQLDRVNLNLIGHYTFSDAFEPYVEATWSHTTVYGSGASGPAFINGTFTGDPRERISINNPYLTDQARGVILANNPTATSFAVREVMLGLGVRAERSFRDTYRAVAGVRGDFWDGWNYDVSANYGEFQEKTNILGNLNIQRFLLANDAVRNASGQIVCRSQVNPAAAGTDMAGNASVLAADVSACTPINVMGGQFTNAQRAYLLQSTTSAGKITQFDVTGAVTGNLDKLFTLPGGSVGFSIGGEYRRETNYYRQDPLVEQGYTFYNSIPTFTAPALAVKEAFGEVRIPFIKDVTLLKELSVSAAARVSDYNTSAGTVWSYNVGGDWRPVEDIHFRANYARAVRAPNLGELYTPAGQNYAFISDPCSADNINGGPNPTNRAANCASAGRPTNYNFQYSNSLAFKSGGNINLQAEKSDSYTYGVVLQPHWVPGLTLSVDYYNIKVRNVISSLDAQTIINQCYDSASLSNPYCALFRRNMSGGTGPNGEVPFQIIENSLLAASLNYAQLRARGIDADLNYTHQIDGIGRLSLELQYSHLIQRDDYLNPSDPSFRTRVRGNLGAPIDRFVLNTGLKTGPVELGYRLRWNGRQYVGAFEYYNSLNGNPPSDPYYANYKYYPVVAYHDLRVAVNATDKFSWYIGVDNVTDRHPPLDTTGLGGGSGLYDVRGRYIYSGVSARF
ncbi:TonB-dependent receptor domain-containing protein [Sphingomonas fuzhouensis]|uniref:TonB-dependent receptor domain-containing protein n=1 Tax=Sphingomonas fuzhouensis TaxID=3106033 RepID=UPI002AFEB95A|nr:TonB-dependent receptor [Sphingomonas sp. SGZ-02]